MLSVAGHLTIFQTRTRGPWWSSRPAWILLAAVFGTQIFATVICVFGILVTPLWWGWAALVWGYAIAWFLVTDPVKLLAYRVLDHFKTEPKVNTPAVAKAAPQTDPQKSDAKPAAPTPDPSPAAPAAKAAPEPDPKSDAPPTAEAAAKPEGNAAVSSALDMTLGELLLAGMAKDPEDAGRMIAAAIASTPAPKPKAGE
jgi:H+-transporting ATPase